MTFHCAFQMMPSMLSCYAAVVNYTQVGAGRDGDEERGRPKGPLAGLKIIDLSHVMAGPTCTLLLADMGADVVKVEKIPGGDDAHHMLPPAIGDESAAFLMMNRNKRGMAVNLKSEAGRKALLRVLEDADVLVENYRRGTMERMGLGYEALHALNPRLIYCSISGFGRTGPYADRGGFDLVAQGMSGLMSITGEGPGRPPMKAGRPLPISLRVFLPAWGYWRRYIRAIHREGPVGRYFSIRSGHHAHLLAVGDLLRDGNAAGGHGFGASVECAVPGFSHRGWMDHRGRGKSNQLAPAARSARCAAIGRMIRDLPRTRAE